MSKTKLGTLYWDDNEGVGVVKFSKGLNDEPVILALDALQDWGNELHDEYNRQLVRSRLEWEAMRAKIKDAESKCTSSK